MPNDTAAQVIIIIAVIAALTFLLRAAPFFVFSKQKTVPKYITYLGTVLPFAVMGMLVVYCLKAVSVTAFPFGLPELIAIVFIVAVHKWKHNLLVSILGGTALYMALVQTVFQ